MARRPRVAVLIPAGGLGTRIGSRTPKQFLRLGGAPILAMTLRHFTGHPAVAAVVVAAPAAYVARARALVARRRGVEVVAGGSTRQESVWCALQAAPGECEIAVVHDAVRPFISRALIDAVVEAAAAGGAAICALPIAETIKHVRDGVVEATVDRAGLWAVQTPQAFRTQALREALADPDSLPAASDDAMLVERLGHPVRVVPGLAGNLKITTPEDLRRARAR